MESDSKGRDQPNSLSGSISIKNGNRVWKFPYGADGYHALDDASLFSSSLPVLPHEKLDFEYCHHSGRPVDDSSFYKLDAGTEEKDPLDDLDLNVLPEDEDELLAGVMEALGLNFSSNQTDDLEEYDLFGSGGGLELEPEPREHTPIGMRKMNIADVVLGNGFGHQQFANGVAKTSGEHPYGEHPSRTLFVRNINSNVEDSELTSLFQRFGDIRTLYTACKHRGFVMISYYDIRAARTAMRALQGKPLRRRNLDIHFSIPKDNPSEKDMNQGTLVIFNLDSSVSNDDLLKIFGVYGEIRETPNKRHHKFIEYYDVRAAEAALKALNMIDIAGKRIKLEPSRPGGARRGLMLQQLTQELERDKAQVFQGGSPVANSPPGNWSLYGSPADHTPLHVFSSSPGQGSLSPINTSHSPGLASLLPHHMSNSPKLAPIGKDQSRTSSTNAIYANTGSGFSSSPHSSGNRTLSGPEFLWGSPKSPSQFPDYASTSLSTSPSGHQHHPFSYTSRRSSLLRTHQNHIGSAPSGGYLDQHLGCFSNSPDKSSMGSAGFGIMGLNRNNGSFSSHIGPHGTINTGFGLPGNAVENGSPSFHTMSVPRPFFPGNGSYTGFSEGFIDRNRGQMFEYTANHIDSKKQFNIDLDKIISGEDIRTTLMIKNIPNKYTSKMLLAAIDENHGGTYNFLYLPIDFKNKCNVGYAFINMVSPSDVISFYQTFNGKKWEKFNSEKVATLAYARIQGKTALVAHFQNSSLMNEDKRCRPIIFLSEGQQIGAQEHLLSSNLNICIRQPDGSYSVDALESSTYNSDENPDKFQL